MLVPSTPVTPHACPQSLYAFYLLPVEHGMVASSARSISQWLEGKVRQGLYFKTWQKG